MKNFEEPSPEEIRAILAEWDIARHKDYVFELRFCLKKDRNIDIVVDAQPVAPTKDVAELLFFLSMGGLNSQIVAVLNEHARQGTDKRKQVSRILNYWEKLEDKPYIDAFQPPK